MSYWTGGERYECVTLFAYEPARTQTVPSPEKRTFSLPAEQAGYIDTLVASGSYASGSEVVRAGLRALQERDAAVEKWLREEVVGVCDAMGPDPGRAIPGEQVFATVRARHADRLKKRREPQD
jgi:antitoxin ParD1/3/4